VSVSIRRSPGAAFPVDILDVDPPLIGVAPGDVVDVPEAVAGRGPFWRPAAEGEDIRHKAAREAPAGLEVRDLGYGLLAREGEWEPVKPSSKPSKPVSPADATTSGE
jgi:hypothetical protein